MLQLSTYTTFVNKQGREDFLPRSNHPKPIKQAPGEISLFVATGAFTKFFLMGGLFNSWIYRDKSLLTISTVGGQYKETQRKYDLGLVTGINYGYKRLSIDLRYQLEKGRSNSSFVNTALQRFAAILMYNL